MNKNKRKKKPHTRKKHISNLTNIGKSFKTWARNPVVMMPILFVLVIMIVIMLLTLVVSLKFFSNLNLTSFANANITKLISTLASKQFFGWLIGMITLVSIILAFVYSFFYSALIGLANQIMDTKTIKFKQGMGILWKQGKKFWLRYIGVKALTSLMLLVYVAIFSFLLMQKNVATTVLSIIGFVVLPFIVVFLLLAPQALIVKNSSVWQSIVSSYKIVRKNYLGLLGLFVLWILMFTVTSLFNFNPFAGVILQLATQFILVPCQIISFLLFFRDRE